MAGGKSKSTVSGSGDALRLFMAIDLPDRIKKHLDSIQQRLRASGVRLRWVKADNLHVTLHFFGDIDAARVSAITAVMDRTARSALAFALQTKGLGAFPHVRRPRVVWAGLDGDLTALQSLSAALDHGLAGCGFKQKKKRFHPHLTLGRCRKTSDASAVEQALSPLAAATSGMFTVDRVGLYNSVLTPQGARYTSLHVSRLADSPASRLQAPIARPSSGGRTRLL